MINKFLERTLYLCVIGISVSLLFFVIISTLIGFEVKDQCANVLTEYEGDCVKALGALVNDEKKTFRSRNSAIWALGQLGDARSLQQLEMFYTGDNPDGKSLDEGISQFELKKAIKLAEGGINLTAWVWRRGFDSFAKIERELIEETIIVSFPSDPYYELAQEIAKTEQLEIVETITDAFQFNPNYIILVSSPENLHEERLINIGKIFKQQDRYPAMGIITGSTMNIAKKLYLRRGLVQNEEFYIGSDIEVGQSTFEPVIINISKDLANTIELNKENLVETLTQADYFYWVRHVTSNKWFWNSEAEDFSEKDKLFESEIPELKPIIIYSPSCGSFQPWVDDSIAIGFIDKGAAIYAGNMHSPNSNSFIMRKGNSVPGIFTWEDFPIGIVAQIQNRMSTKTMMNTPLFFLMGDPRVFQSKEKLYEINSDTIEKNGNRIIEGKSSIVGILPIKIENGAEYDYIQINDETSTSESDLFFNNNIHSMNLNEDKYILYGHNGGDFKISLLKKAPVLWLITDTFLDAFEYSWVVFGMVESPFIILFLLAFMGIILYKILRKKRNIMEYRIEIAIAFLFTFLKLIYFLLRKDDYSVSASIIDPSISNVFLGFIGVFSAAAGGLIVMRDSKKAIGKLIGILIFTMPQVLFSDFQFIGIAITNIMFKTQNQTSITLWNYNKFWLSFIVLIFETFIGITIYLFLKKKSGYRAKNFH